MVQRSSRRGGRSQHYFVSPVRYTLSAGGDDAELWGARLAGVLFVVTGTLLTALLLLPLLGRAGGVFLAMFAPFWGVLGLVTIIPTRAEAWVLPSFGLVFLAVGLGIVRGWRIAHFAGIILAATVFVPALWGGPIVGGFLIVALYRGQKALLAGEDPARASAQR